MKEKETDQLCAMELGEGSNKHMLYFDTPEKMNKLTEPDLEQCQAEKPNGVTFMTFGGKPEMVRCTSKPTVVVTEKEPRKDGLKGSMSLCDHCLKKFHEQMGEDYAAVARANPLYEAIKKILLENATVDDDLDLMYPESWYRDVAEEIDECAQEHLLQIKTIRCEACCKKATVKIRPGGGIFLPDGWGLHGSRRDLEEAPEEDIVCFCNSCSKRK